MRIKTNINRWSTGLCVFVVAALLAGLPACGGSPKEAEKPTPAIDKEEEGKKAFTQAVAAEESGDMAAAEMHYIKASEMRPTHFETAERYVRFLIEKKREGVEAVKVAKAFLERAPDELSGYMLLADAQIAADDPDAAYQTLTDLIALDATAAAYAKRGKLQVRRGEYEPGVADIREAIKLDGANLDHQVALGDAMKEQGQLDEAAEVLQVVLKDDPEHIGALLSYGAVLRDQGDPDQAFELHQRAVELDGSDHRTHYELGISQFYLRKNEEAEASLQRATQLEPRDAQSWYVYGELLRNRQEYEQAADKYRKAREIDIDHDKASTKLALMLIYLATAEAYDEARTVLQARIEREPKDAAAHFLLGEVYEKQEQYAEALASYEAFIEIAERGDPDISQARRKVRQLKSKVR